MFKFKMTQKIKEQNKTYQNLKNQFKKKIMPC